MSHHIPVYARFQWLNHPLITKLVRPFFKYRGRGRRGYDKTELFLWLCYHQLMGCSYRDLQSITGIDYSTFIKFRGRLKRTLPTLLNSLTVRVLKLLPRLRLILDSSFVETYSKHDEDGSAYSGYHEKNGFKLHQIIDYALRLPLLQLTSAGHMPDIKGGEFLLSRAPPDWKVQSVSADKGYDSEYFVKAIVSKWGTRPAIPQRRLRYDGNGENRRMRGANRSRNPAEYRERTEIERYFSRKKRVFRLGEEKTRHLENFHTNCLFTSCMEILERLTKEAA